MGLLDAGQQKRLDYSISAKLTTTGERCQENPIYFQPNPSEFIFFNVFIEI